MSAPVTFSMDPFTLDILNELIQIGLALQPPPPTPKTFSLASAEISAGPVKVKQQYMIYIQLYGVPLYGVFQKDLLDKIVAEYKL
jgi:hypothetical protein